MIKPLKNHVLIQELPHDTGTAGGILQAVEPKYPPASRGLVLGIGANVKDVAPGDAVFYRTGTGREVPMGADKCRILSIEEVLARTDRT